MWTKISKNREEIRKIDKNKKNPQNYKKAVMKTRKNV